MTDSQPIIGVTMGDPAGIGPEVIVKAYRRFLDSGRPIVIGDGDVLAAATEVCESDLRVKRVETVTDARFGSGAIPVVDLDNVGRLVRGEVREEYGNASLEYIERAIELAQAGEINGITTAPINKQATKLAGSTYAGHTGMLADRTDTSEYAMMLIESELRVTHVSTHVPLVEACQQVTTSSVLSTIRLTADALADLGDQDPTVGVAGLNPHASDGGLLGDTEATEIEPAVEQAREAGIDAVGPESPDTVYVRAAQGEFDCVVSMYHDQGHIPIKMLGFNSGQAVSGVNVTIGLPIIRTSVDHGTAFDIAGEGLASEQSLLDAFDVAVEMAHARTT
ncbi:4-hydroxythreonine-4-phosphate dehydrogenase [Halobellus salinus]|uniref:4-hydroxythreonine-4-phosphate dehydrogenase n=1 Tax=Halobellus salinus TaxID=931585 RepID=A0A830EQZ5_9EURY|nr:4-hydroxythreonine-4-phosphate dehydrogenase PdxA [Halobellus salinus]GGJ01574.1 4-hydroxythreonine-4-phosphate dehydrogenase [Halobellus salinus]SMP18369.1 4-hydroxythreonine-4-phosphate dehydrogenase [Halobellus salinus]